MRIQAFAMGLALAWATVGVARADDVLFTITGGDKTATFALPVNPPPPTFQGQGVFFSILSVSARVGGSPRTIANLTFFHEGIGDGGFTADGLFNFMFAPQFYSGLESAPTFLTTGSYELYNYATRKTDKVTLTELFTDPPPPPPTMAIPEPSTWAMLLLGFVGLGYAGYRKAMTRTLN
jgi:hypothetical protein